MAFKTISENAKTFTFTYTFEDFYTAKIATNAIIGYLHGAYEKPTYRVAIEEKSRLVLEYREDSDLNEFFNWICVVAVKCCTE